MPHLPRKGIHAVSHAAARKAWLRKWRARPCEICEPHLTIAEWLDLDYLTRCRQHPIDQRWACEDCYAALCDVYEDDEPEGEPMTYDEWFDSNTQALEDDMMEAVRKPWDDPR